MKNDQAVSEIIGTILIIILVVALAAVIAALFMGLIDLTPKSAFIAPDISGQTVPVKNGGKINIVQMYNRGGDTATLDLSGQGQYPMSVWVDTSSGSYRAVPAPGVNLFSPGTNLYVYSGTGNYQSGGYQITNNISALNSNGGVYYPIGVRLIDDASHLLIIRWNSTGSSGGILAGHLLFNGTQSYTYPSINAFNATTTLKISAQVYPVLKNDTVPLSGFDYNKYMYFIVGKGSDGKENYDFCIATAPLTGGGGAIMRARRSGSNTLAKTETNI